MFWEVDITLDIGNSQPITDKQTHPPICELSNPETLVESPGNPQERTVVEKVKAKIEKEKKKKEKNNIVWPGNPRR